MKTALVQLCSGDDPAENLEQILAHVADAAAQGAGFVLTPEVSNCVSSRRSHQAEVLQLEQDDQSLAALRKQASALGLWVLIGSLGLRTTDPDGRFANRSFLISPTGDVAARYDKIHMFDVDVSPTETYRESAGYRPGDRAVVAETPFAKIGMSVCYDVRFPMLYQTLARAGAEVLTVPAAFSTVTGEAHWHSLLKARAIETGCYVLAPAQTGTHPGQSNKDRRTFGHSLAVDPWGKVLVDAGTEPGVHLLDLDRKVVAEARRRVPALSNARPFSGP